jgi:hypothetical protein
MQRRSFIDHETAVGKFDGLLEVVQTSAQAAPNIVRSMAGYSCRVLAHRNGSPPVMFAMFQRSGIDDEQVGLQDRRSQTEIEKIRKELVRA